MGKEIFRGHLEECFDHYIETLSFIAPKGTRGSPEAKRPLVGFCGVTISTVTRWFNQKILPIGEILIKLTCFLQLLGYRVIEFERLPQIRRNFAELIGFGLLSGQEACQLLGYKKSNSLYLVLQGKEGMSQEKKEKMWEVWKKRRVELEQRKSELEKKLVGENKDASVWQLIRRLLDIIEAGEFSAEQNWPELMVNDVFRLGTCLSDLASQNVLSTKKEVDNEKGYEAIVVKLIEAGKHGPYAVARLKDVGLVTFSLEPKVWQERDWLRVGDLCGPRGFDKETRRLASTTGSVFESDRRGEKV